MNAANAVMVTMPKREGLVAVLPACQGRVFYFRYSVIITGYVTLIKDNEES